MTFTFNMISPELLELHNAIKKKYAKGATIFMEGNLPLHYYQIISGEVKMSNFNDDAREFIQGIFHEGQSFGEPPLFIERTYPASAIAVSDCEIYVLTKVQFLDMVATNSEVSLEIIENLSRRLHYKSVIAAEISTHDPEHRLLMFMDYSIKFFELKKGKDGYLINLTRQQMADLTGLRVETVIRTIKSLEKKNQIKIISRKVYR